jgi:hypothetical protein
MNAPAVIRLHSDNLSIAKALAALGLHIFPCQAGGPAPKKPCYNVKWRRESSTDPAQLDRWWKQFPGALPAIDLSKDGLVVIDADRHGGPDGVEAWRSLCEGKGVSAPIVETPSGGQHAYFSQPEEGDKLTNKRGKLPAGIDVRGDGGYVIAPGATMTDGRCYEMHGSFEDIQPVPDWLAEILRDKGEVEITQTVSVSNVVRPQALQREAAPHPAYVEKALSDELSQLASALKGGSNHTLNEVAFALGQMAGAGWISHGQAYGWLEATAWGNPAIQGDGRRQMLGTIRSGLESGMKKPRQMPEGRGDDALAEIGAQIAQMLTMPRDGVIDVEHTEVKPAPSGPPSDMEEFPARLTYPGGLIGEIVDWVEATARFPNRAIALASALSVLGTAMGREWCGPTGSSTTLYTLILAPTGAGKDHALEQTDRLMTKAGMSDLLGAGNFQSANAIASFVLRRPLGLCTIDEFGSFLDKISRKNASPFARECSANLRVLWSMKFKQWRSSEYARQASVPIWAPAFNLLAASTPKEFYAALRGADISNGFFNRFFVVSVTKKPAEREPLLAPEDMPEEIRRKLVFAMTRGRLHDWKRDGAQEVVPTKVRWGVGGEEAYAEFKEELDLRTEDDEDAIDFYSRTKEMALRIATIAGFGKDMKMPVIDAETMQWASKVALWSTGQMYEQYKEYAAETEAQALAKEIVRHVKLCCKTEKRMAHSHLLKRLDYRFRANEVKGAIELLVMAGDIKMEQVKSGKEGGRPAVFYRP